MAEEKKTCETCWHSYLGPGYEPCASCDDDCSNWETANTKKVIEEQSWACKEPEKYTYFVVYSFLNENNQNGVGSCYVEREDRIRTKNDLEDIAADIRVKFDFLRITILNWKELEG